MKKKNKVLLAALAMAVGVSVSELEASWDAFKSDYNEMIK